MTRAGELLRSIEERRVRVRAAAGCARLVLDQVDGPEAAHLLDLAIAGDDLRQAAASLRSAIDRMRDPASKAAAFAALAVAGDDEALATIPDMVADCAARSSMECGVDAATRWAEDKCEEIVRGTIS